MPAPSDAILLTAHGTVQSIDELPEFLLRIRHGRPAPPELVAELERRYRAIGGSPLLEVTRAQAAALSRALELPVYVGMRLFRPELAEALTEAAAAGVKRLCVLPLAPFSVHVYMKAAERAASDGGFDVELVGIEPFGQSPEFVAAQAELIRPHLRGDRGEQLVLTAHSLPLAVVRGGDPYSSQVEATARAVSAALGVNGELAYQSQGMDGGDWLGPDLASVMRELKGRGKTKLVVAPIGFLSDHVETLYDLDIEAKGQAAALGLTFERIVALNTSPGLISALAAAARRALLS
jgi:ferrochelatase